MAPLNDTATSFEHRLDCPGSLPNPPTKLMSTPNAVLFLNVPTNQTGHQFCCGAATTIHTYSDNDCFAFCSVDSNHTQVSDCLLDSGASRTSTFHSASYGSAASSLSKPALGMVAMVIGNLIFSCF